MENNIPEIPRRNRLDKNTKEELAIHTAIEAVEQMGADPLLTDAVNLLSQAKDKISDFIDKCDTEGAHGSVEMEKFREAARPLIKYMAENHHPHKKAIITSNRAELLEGQISIAVNDYID